MFSHSKTFHAKFYCVLILPLLVGRPTEVKEEDVYLCSAHYNEDELKFRRNVKGFRVSDKSFLVYHLFFAYKKQSSADGLQNRCFLKISQYSQGKTCVVASF